MSMRFLLALALGFALSTAPAFAADPAVAKPKANGALGVEELLSLLHNQEVNLGDDANVNDVPLFELLVKLGKLYNVTFAIVEEAFKAEDINDMKDRKPNVTVTQQKGMTPHQLLTSILTSMDATYLVKNGRIEIVPIKYAAKITKSAITEHKDGRKMLTDPLVSLVVKEKAFNEAVALVAEQYDLNVVVSPQSGDGRMGFVTARLLNVPADKALELLALQCDLRVVRKGNAFLVTSRDHANEMFGEQIERQRQLIELEKFRTAPPPKPEPEPKPEPPKPEPKQEK